MRLANDLYRRLKQYEELIDRFDCNAKHNSDLFDFTEENVKINQASVAAMKRTSSLVRGIVDLPKIDFQSVFDYINENFKSILTKSSAFNEDQGDMSDSNATFDITKVVNGRVISIPFKEFWFEYNKQGNSDRIGCVVRCFDRNDHSLSEHALSEETPFQDGDTLLLARVLRFQGDSFDEIGYFSQVARKDGEVVNCNVDICHQYHEAMTLALKDPKLEEQEFAAMSVIGWALITSVFAMELMTCKNVKLVDDKIPDKLVKKALKVGRPIPFTSCKIITILPMGGGERSTLGGGNGGSGRITQIRRGHFKTFSPDKPLFGRYAGRYWWNGYAKDTSKTYKFPDKVKLNGV